MTIPIIPGPFSFISGAADVYANYAKAKEAKRQQMLKEDMQTIQQLLSLNAAGVVGNKAFGEPGVLATLHRIGAQIGQTDIMPKLEETVAGAQGQAAQDIIAQGSRQGRDVSIQLPAGAGPEVPSMPFSFSNVGGSTDEQVARKESLLSTGKIPTTATVTDAVTATKIARARAKAITKGGAQGAAATGIPSDIQAAVSEAAAAVPLTQSFATTAAMAAATKHKGLITDQNFEQVRKDAWETAVTGAATRGYQVDELRDRPYVDAAVEKLRQDQQEIEIKKMAATARGTSDYNQLLATIERENARVVGMLNALPKISETDKILAAQVEAAIQKDPKADPESVVAKLSPMLVQAWQRVNDDKNSRQWLNDQVQYRQSQLGVIESARTGQDFSPPPRPGTPGAAPRAGQRATGAQATQARVDAATLYKRITDQKADVEKTLKAYAGKIDQATIDEVRRLDKAKQATAPMGKARF